MGEYRIIGGKCLDGEIKIGGSKNAVLPILAASVLGLAKKSVIHNCPMISDTIDTIEILRALGCDVVIDANTVMVDSSNIITNEIPAKIAAKMRSSIIFAGAILGRLGSVVVHQPGGCELGKRPINFHLDAFERLGASAIDEGKKIDIISDGLYGSKIQLLKPSVGATQNAMLAAVFAKGRTRIVNAAREPEIIDLQNYLNACGAKVNGAGEFEIVVEGVAKTNPKECVEYSIMPDRIVAGTYLVAAAITGGKVRINGISGEDMRPITARLDEAGFKIDCGANYIGLNAKNANINCIEYMTTGPHPAFPTDMQPQLTALLSIAGGESIISERIFEARDKHILELRKLGADIKVYNGRRFHINGVKELVGAEVIARDLRGGASLILAALAAKGKTTVKCAEYVERGYESIHSDLAALGAEIELVR